MKQIYQLCFTFLIGLFWFVNNSNASDIINVEALNSRIILIHFDDGYVRYHQQGESRQNEWVISEPLNITKATNIGNYEIRSNEGYYTNPKNPVRFRANQKEQNLHGYAKIMVANCWLCKCKS